MILIVDDNSENIFSLKSLLTLHQFNVDSALSGEEALKKVLQYSYSLIILDVQMPDMDGFEVAEAMAGYSKSKDIPIIFLSAVNTNKKFVTKGYASGGIDYVTKPFDPDILLLKVKTFYRLSEQTRKLTLLEKNLREEIELRKQAEEVLERKVQERTSELKISNKQLEESNKELQQFAFIASHDLQEPLRKIQLFCSMAGQLPEEDVTGVKALLNKVRAATSRLRNLIVDILEYSQISVDKDFVRSSLNDIISEILGDLEIQVKEKQALLDVGQLPAAEIIPTQMRQVFQNIISNALKFSREGVRSEISIHGERIKDKSFESEPCDSGDYLRIQIADNGIGFPQQHVDKIFEVFRRLNTRDQYQGNGMGLAIVKKVIDRHHGLISARSEEHAGTTFVLILPLKQNSITPNETQLTERHEK